MNVVDYELNDHVSRITLGGAQCRLREHQEEPPSTSEPRSVNGVVASLIRSIEANRYTVLDTPAHVRLDCSGGQDATTQTSPFSISRSSSFDWINEPAEVGLRDLATPLGTPRINVAKPLSFDCNQGWPVTGRDIGVYG
uniref:ATP-binding cassette transporter n=1 Tax=Angiostrongylus cantonensis TaxID=6313 RepID=A0A0K0DNX7_ANGCA